MKLVPEYLGLYLTLQTLHGSGLSINFCTTTNFKVTMPEYLLHYFPGAQPATVKTLIMKLEQVSALMYTEWHSFEP